MLENLIQIWFMFSSIFFKMKTESRAKLSTYLHLYTANCKPNWFSALGRFKDNSQVVFIR